MEIGGNRRGLGQTISGGNRWVLAETLSVEIGGNRWVLGKQYRRALADMVDEDFLEKR